MTVHDYVRILRRNALLITAFALIGVASGALVALMTPPRYDSSTQLYIAVQLGPDVVADELVQGTSYAHQIVSSYVQVATSAIVLDPVIDELGLEETSAALAETLTVSSDQNTVLLTVTASDDDPEQSARVANAVADSLITVVAGELESTTASVHIESLGPARVPVEPVAPRMPLSITLGAALGLITGLTIAALRTLLDARTHTIRDVEEVTHAPTLAGIALDPDAGSRPLIVAASPHDPRAEAFRSLRTNVRFLAIDGASSAFMVTSAGPGEGKSTTTANLAIALAEAGHRVVVLDGDLRRPKVAQYFGVEGGAGLSDVLAGRTRASDVLQRWGPDTLFLLPAGTLPPNPAELLGSTAMGRLMDELRGAFDVVLVDTPPLLLVTDAAVVSPFTDGAILVAASGVTTRSRLADAVKALEAVGARTVGTVVTMLPTKGADKTTYGSYAYVTTNRTAVR